MSEDEPTGGTDGASIRPYDPDSEADRDALWRLKRAFETELAAGDEAKAARYADKLTPAYRDRYLAWATDCVAREADCLRMAVVADEKGGREAVAATEHDDTITAPGEEAESGPEPKADRAPTADPVGEVAAGHAVGYVFVLPEAFAPIWDAAVLNEVYVAPTHRGTTVADALMRAAIAHGREQDLPLDRLVLDVDRENDRARAFYDRHGFDSWAEMLVRPL